MTKGGKYTTDNNVITGDAWSDDCGVYLREAIDRGSLVTVTSTGTTKSVYDVPIRSVQIELQDKVIVYCNGTSLVH